MMMYELWLTAIRHPVVLLPALIVTMRLSIALATCFKTRDWFSFYNVLAQLGVDLSFLALSVYLSFLVNSFDMLAGFIVEPNATGRDKVMAVTLIAFMLVLALLAAMWLNGEARAIGRKRVAIVHKIGSVGAIVTDDVSARMLDAVRKLALFRQNQGSLLGGVSCLLLGLCVGVGALWLVVRLVMGD
jgi:hypothetical protein